MEKCLLLLASILILEFTYILIFLSNFNNIAPAVSYKLLCKCTIDEYNKPQYISTY